MEISRVSVRRLVFILSTLVDWQMTRYLQSKLKFITEDVTHDLVINYIVIIRASFGCLGDKMIDTSSKDPDILTLSGVCAQEIM